MRVDHRNEVGWPSAFALILLSAIPIIGGVLRLKGIAPGAPVTPDNVRFVNAPAPIVLHVVSASLFCVFGAFQFVAGFRRRMPRWHRVAGRLWTALGLVAGLSGLWMNLSYDLPATDNALLYAFRLLFGSAMVACLALGFAAMRRKDVRRHSAWMTRGYAIGLGAGTQALVQVPFSLDGPPGVLGRSLLMGAGWGINLAIAEWLIRRRSPARPTPGQPLAAGGGVP
ncbi:MAG: DUF2306 domain-containing protein [Myxococcaceae bacterium]|nr:MAG: DUF2306 domain-containing protein [Myxococcaceae bacterium]